MSQNNGLIYSPQYHIPLGQPVKRDGYTALVVKWGHGESAVTEEIKVETFLELIFNGVNRSGKQGVQ